MLVTLYKVPSFDSVDDFLQKVATVRGKLKKGGIVDIDAAARIVLHDWNEGMFYQHLSPLLQHLNHGFFTIFSCLEISEMRDYVVHFGIIFDISLCFPR